ncbi:methylcrotonoyl-CoA carboxylase, partial [Escherichia coli]|nr:methylcrotonoyl-CoA carboxylase [Escherichia coli]
AEELGGGDLHAKTSGVVDHLAENDEHALMIIRDIVSTLPANPAPAWSIEEQVAEPLYPGSELAGVVPVDVNAPYDVHEVIARIVDSSKFHEFKAEYGTTLVTGFAHIHGH